MRELTKNEIRDIAETTKLLKYLPYGSFVTVNYNFDSGEMYFFIEFNPRMYRSLIGQKLEAIGGGRTTANIAILPLTRRYFIYELEEVLPRMFSAYEKEENI